uniref:Uncharacterized protein n=1 Tax=Cacopsylla melanoneura TaxID=428564 RepID=A0A8D9E8N1_9HEMI
MEMHTNQHRKLCRTVDANAEPLVINHTRQTEEKLHRRISDNIEHGKVNTHYTFTTPPGGTPPPLARLGTDEKMIRNGKHIDRQNENNISKGWETMVEKRRQRSK